MCVGGFVCVCVIYCVCMGVFVLASVCLCAHACVIILCLWAYLGVFVCVFDKQAYTQVLHYKYHLPSKQSRQYDCTYGVCNDLTRTGGVDPKAR